MPLLTTIGAASAKALGFGSGPSNRYFFLYGGTFNSANSFGQGGLIASAQGTVIASTKSSTNTNQSTRFNNEGTYLSSSTVSAGDNGPRFVDSSTSNPKWYYVSPTYYANYTTESAPTTWQMGSAISASTNSNLEIDQICANSNGVIALTQAYRVGKTDYPAIALYSSSGAFVDARGVTANGPPSWQYTKIKPRTDNNFVWYHMRGNTFDSWLVSPTSAVPTNAARYSGGTGGGDFRNSVIDANNNIYGAGMPTAYSQIDVMRVNSSRAPTHFVRWEINNGGFSGYDLYDQYNTAIAQYGNYVYLAHGAYIGTPRVGYWFVICLNAADLTFAWGKSFTSPDWNVGGANAYTGALGGGSQSKFIWANQYGLWMLWGAGTTTASQQFTYLTKLPLDGSGINGTYSVGGKNITIANYTPTLTSLVAPSSLTTNTPTTSARTSITTTNSTFSAGTNPAPTKTLLG